MIVRHVLGGDGYGPPNTIGLVNYATGAGLTFSAMPERRPLQPHAIGIVSQSGSLGFSLGQGIERGVSVSHILTAGNSCDVDVADYVAYLAQDPHCRAIACLFEGMPEPMRLIEAGALAPAAGSDAGLATRADPPARVSARSHPWHAVRCAEPVQFAGDTSMKRVLLPAIAGIALASPALAQDRLASPLKTVRAATRSATVEPAASGFVSGAQVQPFHDGMIYQVYAAPGQITDIVLQEGEQLVGPGPVAAGEERRSVKCAAVAGGRW